MHGVLRSAEAGAIQAVPAVVPGRRAQAASLRTWRGFAPELADVLCMECVGAGLPLQARDELTLVLPRSVARMVDAQGRAWEVGPHDVGIARPGEMYALDAPEDGNVLQVLLVGAETFAADTADPRALRSVEPLRFRTPVVRDPRLAVRLRAVFGELRRGLTALDALTRFRDALAELLVRHVQATTPGAARRVHPGAARACAYLADHVAETVSLDDLTAVSRLSRFYLLRVFRRDYGVTPHEYQRHLRLARACRLLAAGASASRTAYEAGFADQSHLTRLLKSLTGLTPGAFARQWAAPGRPSTRPGHPSPARPSGPRPVPLASAPATPRPG
jgi:AraC-like DNA-binding protein